jgi:hypothetical protein
LSDKICSCSLQVFLGCLADWWRFWSLLSCTLLLLGLFGG